jgi:hypothetical protein
VALEEDGWGKDPGVRFMRRVFAAIEIQQEELLDRLTIHRRDKILGPGRKAALHLFERTWAGAAGRGIGIGERDAADLYVYCLAKVLQTRGIVVPAALLPRNDAIERLMEETG